AEAGLAGAFELARRGFEARQDQADRHRKALDALKPAQGTPTARDVAAVEAEKKLAGQRVEAITALQQSLVALAEQAATVEADGAVLNDHLLEQQILAGAIESAARKEGKEVDLPKRLLGKGLAAELKALGEQTSKARGEGEKARD